MKLLRQMHWRINAFFHDVLHEVLLLAALVGRLAGSSSRMPGTGQADADTQPCRLDYNMPLKAAEGAHQVGGKAADSRRTSCHDAEAERAALARASR